MMWLLANIRTVAFIATVACIPMAYIVGTYSGKVKCQAKQEVTQLKHEVKVRRTHEKIDKKTPYAADRSTRFEWLQQNSSK